MKREKKKQAALALNLQCKVFLFPYLEGKWMKMKENVNQRKIFAGFENPKDGKS